MYLSAVFVLTPESGSSARTPAMLVSIRAIHGFSSASRPTFFSHRRPTVISIIERIIEERPTLAVRVRADFAARYGRYQQGNFTEHICSPKYVQLNCPAHRFDSPTVWAGEIFTAPRSDAMTTAARVPVVPEDPVGHFRAEPAGCAQVLRNGRSVSGNGAIVALSMRRETRKRAPTRIR